MTTTRISVLGGGPAGLFVARLIAKRHPTWDVTLHERLPPLDTFGFGIGLSGGTLRGLGEVDPTIQQDVIREAFAYSSADFRLPSGDIAIPGFHSGVAIGRAQLLQILAKRAEESGVRIVRAIGDVDDLRRGADLCIAADGLGSTSRHRWQQQFGATVRQGRGRFIWCGSSTPLGGSVFAPVETEHGLFVAHAYPYAVDRSTFVVETSAEAWERAGFDDSQAGTQATDQRAIDYLSTTFREVLQGRTLIGNKSQWARFRTVHCQHWTHENVVLLGDAAANAHPSLGSGTKLALESAAELANAIDESSSLSGAAGLFEARRRPQVERLQSAAHRSQLWWETLSCRLGLSPERLAVAYLTRAGVVSIEDLLLTAPDLTTEAVAQFAGVDRGSVPVEDLATWIVNQSEVPASTAHLIEVSFDDAWGPEADSALELARRASSPGRIELIGSPDRASLLDRLAFAERVQVQTGRGVHLRAASNHIADLAGALVSGRATTASSYAVAPRFSQPNPS